MSVSWVIKMKVYENYIATKKLNLDLHQLKYSCGLIYNLVDETFNNEEYKSEHATYDDETGKVSLTTTLYSSYNIFMYPFDQFHELYTEIRTMFRECCIDEEQYYIQCWVNFYKKGDFINWHHHWLPEKRAWHGFFCVDCEPSKTTYRLPGVDEPVDIVSEDNLLVLGPSNGDTHRTWPWEDENRDRITIAFDIVPRQYVHTPGKKMAINHWVPI